MNDRELLELAAKAAGVELETPMLGRGKEVVFVSGKPIGFRLVSGGIWNPLEDDGDALRLAVMLKLQVIIYSDWVEVLQDGIRKTTADSVYDAGCMLTCTRRAIVRAAAGIGRAM